MTPPYEPEIAALKQKITELEAKIAADNKPEIVPWVPKGGQYWISGESLVEAYPTRDAPKEYILASTVRDNKQQAEKAAAEIRKFSRLLAYRDEFAPDYKPYFECDDGKAKIIFVSGKYYMLKDIFSQNVATVYFPEDVAIELVKKLNSGEVVL